MPAFRRALFLPFDVVIVGMAAAVSLAAAMSIAVAAPDKSELVGVVFAPWTDSADAVSRATRSGARFVRFGGADFIVVVAPDRADFRIQASADGALMFVDPKFAGACAPSSEAVRDAT